MSFAHFSFKASRPWPNSMSDVKCPSWANPAIPCPHLCSHSRSFLSIQQVRVVLQKKLAWIWSQLQSETGRSCAWVRFAMILSWFAFHLACALQNDHCILLWSCKAADSFRRLSKPKDVFFIYLHQIDLFLFSSHWERESKNRKCKLWHSQSMAFFFATLDSDLQWFLA